MSTKKNSCWGLVTILVLSTSGIAFAGSLEKSAASVPAAAIPTCKITCVDPHSCSPEAAQVIDVLQKMADAMAKGDLVTVANYLDENCTSFDASGKKLIVGKENILEDIRQLRAKHAPDGPSPLVSYKIDQPYAHLTADGQECVVTFWAEREFGGPHPLREQARFIDVFVKRDNTWKKLHCRWSWKKIS